MGVAPKYMMGLAEAQKVKDWQITSSPAFTPKRTRAKCNELVPELRATA